MPKTSYFKRVDVWLLFCIFTTFLIIVFHIVIDRFRTLFKNLPSAKSIDLKTSYIRVTPVKDSNEKKEFAPKNKKKVFFELWINDEKNFQRIGKIVIAFEMITFNLIYWLDITRYRNL